MLDKNFDPKDYEESIYKKEEEAFLKKTPRNKKFSIMMPPPNVTGSLHLGHALTYTLQDVLIRFKRMQGYDVFWQPGTDHAGIATQTLVEKKLKKEQNKTRFDFERDEFLKHVWAWKEQSGETIVHQQKRLCISAHWDDARFTLDEGLCRSVTEAFVRLYNDQLIYKDKALVNWDPFLKTAISDLEVVNKNQSGKLWYLRYDFVDLKESIIIATSRPETIFADQAIAVHPDDERYKQYIGKTVFIPLIRKEIPVIADEYCDIEKGSGAVKITPAHDFNDFEVGKRHNLELFNILNDDCCLNENVPNQYQGISVQDARKKIILELEEKGCLEKVEDVEQSVPYGDRSDQKIEPRLTDQWFLDAKKLSVQALKVVEEGKTSFIPKQWKNTYFDWLKNIQPWCLSRQLWWGHRIPSWYGPDGHIFVAKSDEDAKAQAKIFYGEDVLLTQDPDVLDTWFSSGLWPFSTLGWPDETQKIHDYFPTSVLVTGFDIIFFWVARMMMLSLYFMKDIPFKDIYIHALIRDEKGQKMSKSKGNVIDPLELVDLYGVDALRFALCFLSTPGRDIKIGKKIVENHRHFMTKLWNSARFLEMNQCAFNDDFSGTITHPLSKWLLHQLSLLNKKATDYLDEYRFDLYASCLHQWFWTIYCDQFLEALKPVLQNASEDEKKEVRHIAVLVFTEILKLLHPVTPMITEKLWATFRSNENLLMLQDWPCSNDQYIEQFNALENIFSFASDVRSFKGLMGLSSADKMSVVFADKDADIEKILSLKDVIISLSRLDDLSVQTIYDESYIPFVFSGIQAYVKLNSEVDQEKIYVVLEKKYEIYKNDIMRLEQKINNEAYKKSKPDSWQEDSLLYVEKKQIFKQLSELLVVLKGKHS